eukprot:scaffold267_cov192-Amphora_coffeaeformis.AAC.7
MVQHPPSSPSSCTRIKDAAVMASPPHPPRNANEVSEQRISQSMTNYGPKKPPPSSETSMKKDPLLSLKDPPLTSTANPTIPGAHFCTPGFSSSLSSKHHADHPLENSNMMKKTTGRDNVMMVTIAPGLTARLRGAQETWDCIEQDFFIPTECVCCGLELCCIMDAHYVLCPACKVVSPLATMNAAVADYYDNVEESGRGGGTPEPQDVMQEGQGGGGGIGLGFTMSDLRQWQYGILLNRRRRRGQDSTGH